MFTFIQLMDDKKNIVGKTRRVCDLPKSHVLLLSSFVEVHFNNASLIQFHIRLRKWN